ncbi:MAG: hypothetical protein GY822_00710 [Deltaproteobacteria bacterium]|nr:hypothetical protein [Deltaproteobacteria bacterium]
MKVTRLHHLALGAHDVEKVAVFYEDVLGLKKCGTQFTEEGNIRAIWLALGEGAVLMIEELQEHRSIVVGRASGVFLLAVEVSNPVRQSIKATLGDELESETEHTLYFRDPEGNRVAASSFPLFDEED